MVRHLVRIGAVTLVIIACMFLPFLPGRYDALAVTLSAMAQLAGLAGLLLVPIGVLWLIHEVRTRVPERRERSRTHKAYVLAIAALGAASLVAALCSLAAFANVGFSLGIIVLGLWAYGLTRMAPGLKRLKNRVSGMPNPAPLYLVVVPTVVALVRLVLIGPATAFSRDRAIMNSADLIADIERYHETYGRYPTSLLAASSDYRPLVVGIDRYHYEPRGDAYNVFFEQFSTQLGAREIVMYNKRDEHFMASHDGDLLQWTAEQLYARRGYYAVHDIAIPHWRYFWFD